MSATSQITPITETDDFIRAALLDADIPSLLPALAHVLGDMSLLRPSLAHLAMLSNEPQAGLTPEQLDEARQLALEALIKFRDGGCVPAPAPSHDELRTLMSYATSGETTDAYIPLLREELSIDGHDLRAPQWQASTIAPNANFTVAIIGAGMSGLLAAHRLQQAGVEFVILEKNSEVGGTWWDNTYPGCRVDTPNHLYSYSFAQKDDWPLFFSPQHVLLEYFRNFAKEFGLYEHIRFDTEVVSADFDDATNSWSLHVRSAQGDEALDANAVISAVGQLNQPKLPDIAGRDTFAGPSFHSARWDHTVDLIGKRVAVIGTGASAMQFVPIIAKEVGQLSVFQRTPNWLLPVPNYHDPVPAGLNWLLSHVPFYMQWYRFWLFWRIGDGRLIIAQVDPEWTGDKRSVSAMSDLTRELLTMYFQMQLTDQPDLLSKVVPQYPVAAKRMLLDSGTWIPTMQRDNVSLITDDIKQITATGVVTADGVHHEVDVIIYGTGFHASKFLTPLKMRGRNGVDLHDEWNGEARAYMGVTVPKFPNLFLLYGPNTNIVINGSIIYFSECEVNYVLEAIRELLTHDARALDCKQAVHDAYNARIDDGNQRMSWGVADVHSWYKNDSGRVAQNWPFTLLEFWEQTRTVNLDDYELLS